jgi:hypothetical protein
MGWGGKNVHLFLTHSLNTPKNQAYQLVTDMGPEVLGGKAACCGTTTQGGASALLQRLLSSANTNTNTTSSTTTTSGNEAMAWASLRPVEEETAALALLLEGYTHPLSVPAFLRACDGGGVEGPASAASVAAAAGGGEGEGASSSSEAGAGERERERGQAALRLVMRPLLHDVFAVKSLDEALSCLHWGPREVSEWEGVGM